MKVLCLVNGHAVAHVSRTLEIAKELKKRGHNIIFGGGGEYLKIIKNEKFTLYELAFTTQEENKIGMVEGKYELFYKGIEKWIYEDINLIKKINPDILIVDNRLSSFSAAEILKIPIINIANIHITDYKKIPFNNVGNLINNNNFVLKLINNFELMCESFLFNKIVTKELNKTRLKMGLKEKSGFSNEMGDIILFPDIPEFNPSKKLPSNCYYIGPLIWHNKLKKPSFMPKLDKNKKIIYLTMGSEGLESILDVIKDLDQNKFQLIITTSSDKLIETKLPKWIFIEKYINTDYILPYCDLVITHGGNGTIYQALASGVPILGLANHNEQFYNINRAIDCKVGLGIKLKSIKNNNFEVVVKMIDEILFENDIYKKNALIFKDIISKYDGKKKAADIIEEYYNKINISN
ncbi:MAG: hypothetical protein KC589_08375 [Nanoarchaeota archaeon]|nr:hypothetical protein [Nanoarchaeota archaeon]